MPPALPETRASYILLGPGRASAGTEDLVIARHPAGWRLTAELQTSYPVAVRARVEWELDGQLATRLLRILSRDGFGDEYELELTVTGNGMLAHRTGPDGPSQVELGWGPDVELDYLSAAFPIVALARRPLAHGQPRDVSAVHLGTDNLEPVVLRQVWTSTGPGCIEVATPATGHVAKVKVGPDGLLEEYSNLLRLDGAEPIEPYSP